MSETDHMGTLFTKMFIAGLAVGTFLGIIITYVGVNLR